MKATIIPYKTFIEKYTALSTSEQTCLKILGLVIEQVSVQSFAQILAECKIYELNARPITQKLAQKTLEKLAEKNLAVALTSRKFIL